MTARTCRRCRGQEADEHGVPCARCDGYGIESVFAPPPEPGRDFIEWAHSKATQARREAETLSNTRTHGPDCYRWHHECAVRIIEQGRP